MPASLSKSLRAKRTDLIIPTSQLLTTLLATKSAKGMTCYDSAWCIIHICPNLGGWGVLLLLLAVSQATEWDLLSLRWLFSCHQDNFYLDKRTMGEVDIPVFMQMVSIKLHTAARCCLFICRLSSTHAKKHVFHTDPSEACQKAFCYLWFYMVECAHMFKWVSEWKMLSGGVLFFLLSTDATGGLEMQLLSGLCVAKDQGLSKFWCLSANLESQHMYNWKEMQTSKTLSWYLLGFSSGVEAIGL